MSNTNPCCTCFGTHYSPTTCGNPTTGKCNGCLTLGTLTKTNCTMNLCEATDTLEVDFSCFCFPCTTPQFTITNQGDFPNLEVVSITKDKMVVQSTGEGFVTKQSIEFKAVCKEDCTTFSNYGTINLYFIGQCVGTVCEDGFTCDKCDGICKPTAPDLSTDSGFQPDIVT